jgi:hypothetical protein
MMTGEVLQQHLSDTSGGGDYPAPSLTGGGWD